MRHGLPGTLSDGLMRLSDNKSAARPLVKKRPTRSEKEKMMKKTILLALVALAALPAAAQMQEAFPSYIQVNGRAEREVTPDEFHLSILINERDSKGKISVEQQQRDMIAALKRLGVDTGKQLKVANLSSEFFKKRSSLATAKYQLQLGSAAEVTKVWQALDELGISNVSIQRVTHSQIEQFKREVRIEAMRNARENAETLAEAIGQSVGKCFYVYDPNSDAAPYYYNNTVMMRSTAKGIEMDAVAEGEEEPLDFKTIRLQYNLQTKFVLE